MSHILSDPTRPGDESMETSDPDRLVKHPLVSVLMITYNHGDYLADAIESVVQQQCDFPFELIIGEDASTDATRQVALDYQRRYPDRVRVIHSAYNVGMNHNGARIFQRARGTFISYCEGDDFWCTRDKLARQVAMIEADEEVGIVHSDWTRAHLVNGQWVHDFKKSVHHRVANRFLEGDLFPTWHFPKILRTCTILLRKQTVQAELDSGLTIGDYPFGDAILNVFVASRWKVAYVPEVTAVYRVSPNSALRSGAAKRMAFYEGALRFDTAARRYFANDARYSGGYRWDSAAGLLVWGLRARDFGAMKTALRDFRRHFTLWQFLAVGCKTIRLRIPTLRRQRRGTLGQAVQCVRSRPMMSESSLTSSRK
jgi:glycosyltransferase involved in cell wall biosynthesis